jgi:hypothetical protein
MAKNTFFEGPNLVNPVKAEEQEPAIIIDQTKEPENLKDVKEEETADALSTGYVQILNSLVTGKRNRFLGIFDPNDPDTDPNDPDALDKMIEKMGVEAAMGYKLENPGISQEVSDYFKGILVDKEVLDLGAGKEGVTYNLANFCEAAKYIGIEKNFAKSAYRNTKYFANEAEKPIPFKIIQQGMLEYLEASPAKHDVIFLMGVDINIIPQNQWKRLMELISGHLNDGGLVIMGGGAEKPFEIIENYFVKDEETETRLDKTVKKDKGQFIDFPNILFKKK